MHITSRFTGLRQAALVSFTVRGEIMTGIILLLVGVIMMGVGVVVYRAIGGAGVEGISGLPEGIEPEKAVQILQYGISGLVGGLGVIFTLGGIRSLARSAKRKNLAARLMSTGADAVGTVTFVDKNWSVQVNNRPIYSIVEYTFQDSSGNEYSRRIKNLNSDYVVRNQVRVGSKIAVKYDPRDPSQNVMVLYPNPPETGAGNIT